jgi:hypothetical protein
MRRPAQCIQGRERCGVPELHVRARLDAGPYHPDPAPRIAHGSNDDSPPPIDNSSNDDWVRRQQDQDNLQQMLNTQQMINNQQMLNDQQFQQNQQQMINNMNNQ